MGRQLQQSVAFALRQARQVRIGLGVFQGFIHRNQRGGIFLLMILRQRQVIPVVGIGLHLAQFIGGGQIFFRAGIVSLELGGPRSVEEKRGLPLRIPRRGGAAEVSLPGLRELLVAEVRAAEVEEQGVRVRDGAQNCLGAIEAAMVLHRLAQRRQLLRVEARQHGGMVESPPRALGSVVHRAAPQDGQGAIYVAGLFREVRIQIVQPTPNQVTPPDTTLVVNLIGGKVVPATQTTVTGNLPADQGHIHVSLDGTLVNMAYSTTQDLKGLKPGQHTLTAEFVAVDHLPFKNRPTAAVIFMVQGQ